MKANGRRVVIIMVAAGLATVALTAFAIKEPVRDRWYLWKLERATSEGERARLISLLIDRKCGAVVPHVLRFHADHPYDGSIGTTLGYYEGEASRIASIGPSAAPWLARSLDAPQFAIRSMVLDALRELGPGAPRRPSRRWPRC